MRIVIPGELPAMNEIIAAAKSHYGRYSTMKRTNTEAVAWRAKEAGLRRVDRAVVRCTWYAKNRRRDPDNIEAGVKFILDGLVEAGVLSNDGWKQIAGIEHTFRVDANDPRVEIEIREVEEASA